MSNYLNSSCGAPYAVLFPEIYQLVVRVITSSSCLLRLQSTKKVLAECAEELTIKLIKEREHSGTNAPYLNLMEIDDSEAGRLAVYLNHQWEEKVRICSELARVAYPIVFEFVRDYIIFNEQPPNDISSDDIAVLTMVIVEKNKYFYGGKCGWLQSRTQVKRNLEHWFSPEEIT